LLLCWVDIPTGMPDLCVKDSVGTAKLIAFMVRRNPTRTVNAIMIANY